MQLIATEEFDFPERDVLLGELQLKTRAVWNEFARGPGKNWIRPMEDVDNILENNVKGLIIKPTSR